MSTPPPSTRRLAIAIGTAAASVTVAIGVTVASVFGWFGPAAGPRAPEPAQESAPPSPPPGASSTILVPVMPTPEPQAPTEPTGDGQLAMDVGGGGGPRAHDDDDRDDNEEDSDDD